MKRIPVLILSAVLAGAGCGDDDDSTASEGASPDTGAAMKNEDAAMKAEDAAMEKAESAAARRRGTRITLRDSEYGSMLFGPNRQAIYIFQNDARDKSNCYGECAVAWPPVFTRGKPRAGEGVRAPLLGSIERRGGRRQVTYAGQPLYYYANEDPGEVRCHNVNLNGGLWWVIGPNGRRRA
jgi:predicted lipoprotein with Yx(FWY)xxD motif